MLSIIVAMDRNSVIGVSGKIPWHFPEDLLNFSRLTKNHTLIMGGNTFRSMGCRPLKNRYTFVLSKNTPHVKDEIKFITKYPLVIQFYYFLRQDQEVFVCGGAQVYSLFASLIDRMYITIINSKEEYSREVVKFPWKDFSPSNWSVAEQRMLGTNFYYVLDKLQ